MSNQHFILVFHGSTQDSAKELIISLTRALYAKTDASFSVCHLREGHPTLPEALENAYEKGHRQISCMPVLILPGSHTVNEIPRVIEDFQRKHSDTEVKQLQCLARHKQFVDFLASVLENSK